jgi:hypothetical protein
MYFSEKHRPGHVPALTWELYPNGKEIFLVRDFRDMLCSSFDFFTEEETRRNRAADDKQYISWVGGSIRHLYEDWQARRDKAYLVRYEDLILQPEETLTGILGYLELDASREAVNDLLTATATADSKAFEQHRTSASAEASIGRWKRDLSASLQDACHAAFGEELTAFGYVVRQSHKRQTQPSSKSGTS